MEKNHAIEALSALAHDTRIDVFRLLVRAGAEGRIAGDLAETLGVKANTLSNNLTILQQAGLIRSQREGRAIRYFAKFSGMRGLLGFLMRDCCDGRPELCGPFDLCGDDNEC